MAIRNIFLLLSCVAGLVVSEDFDKKNVPTEVLHYLEKEINHELDASQFARIVKIDEYRVVKDRHFHITVTVQDSTCTKEHVGCDTEIEKECKVNPTGTTHRCLAVVAKANWAENPLSLSDLSCE